MSNLLPAMGYGQTQIAELGETINNSPAEIVIIGTPIDLRRVLKLTKPAVRVNYDLEEVEVPGWRSWLRQCLFKYDSPAKLRGYQLDETAER